MEELVGAPLSEALNLIDEVQYDGYGWSSERLRRQCEKIERLRERYGEPLVHLVMGEYQSGTADERLHECAEYITSWLNQCRTLADLVARNPNTVETPLSMQYLPCLPSQVRQAIDRRLTRLMAVEEGADDSEKMSRRSPSRTSGASQRSQKTLSAEARAIATLVSRGDAPITLAAVAESAGCSRTHLYRCPKFMAAWRMRQKSQKVAARSRIPRGSKSEDGRIEAYDDVSRDSSARD